MHPKGYHASGRSAINFLDATDQGKVVALIKCLPYAVSVDPGIWVAAAQVLVTIAIAAFAYVTVRHTRRSAQMERVSRALEELYSPLYAHLRNRGHLYGTMIGGGSFRHRHMEGPIDLWGEIVQPFMVNYRHLASKDLQDAYDEVDRMDDADEGMIDSNSRTVKRFETVVVSDYDKLVLKMNKLAGKNRWNN